MPYYLSEESDLARCAITIPADINDDPRQSLSGMIGAPTYGSFMAGDGAAFWNMQGKTATPDDRPWGLLCGDVATTERISKETSTEGGRASSNDTKRQRIATLKLHQPLTLCLSLGSTNNDQQRDILSCIKSMGRDEGDIEFMETCGTSRRRINRDPSMMAEVLLPERVETFHAFQPIVQRVLQSTGPNSQATCQIHGHASNGGSTLLVAPAQSRYRLDDGRTLLLGCNLRQGRDRSTTYDSLIIKSYLVDVAMVRDHQGDRDSDESDATLTGE